MQVGRLAAATLVIALMGQSVVGLMCTVFCVGTTFEHHHPSAESEACQTATVGSIDPGAPSDHCVRHDFLAMWQWAEFEGLATPMAPRLPELGNHALAFPTIARAVCDATDSSPPDTLSATHLRVIRTTVLRV